MNLYEQLEGVEDHYIQLTKQLADPEVIADTNRLLALSKEEGNLRETIDTYRKYKKAVEEYQEVEEMLQGSLEPDMEELAKEEHDTLMQEKEALEEQLKILLLPKDENDEKNIIMEIRGAAGGDEAQLFAGDLFHMYQKYADNQGWKTEIIEASTSDAGGYKEIIFAIQGNNVYSKLKYESGAHRVQRVPETESQGRIHTSTATVVVMPEAEDVEVNLDANDIRVDIFRASGAGGQHVNMTDSAVRLTHLPTGIVVSMQDERSQIKNREKAMKVLLARVNDYYIQQAQAEVDAERKSAVGTGDRSERIRTYNFPQGRVTDHRVHLTLHKLEQVLNGDLDEIIETLIIEDQTKKLENM
nr:peptide chain release factor 1 [Allofustis seminis]